MGFLFWRCSNVGTGRGAIKAAAWCPVACSTSDGRHNYPRLTPLRAVAAVSPPQPEVEAGKVVDGGEGYELWGYTKQTQNPAVFVPHVFLEEFRQLSMAHAVGSCKKASSTLVAWSSKPSSAQTHGTLVRLETWAGRASLGSPEVQSTLSWLKSFELRSRSRSWGLKRPTAFHFAELGINMMACASQMLGLPCFATQVGVPSRRRWSRMTPGNESKQPI